MFENAALFNVYANSLLREYLWDRHEMMGKQGVSRGLICLWLREAGPCYGTQPRTFAQTTQTHEL